MRTTLRVYSPQGRTALSWDEVFADAGADLALLPRLLVAMALTGLLGLDRERKNRPAGLRTHMLVGLSACSIVLLGEVIVERYVGRHPGQFGFDPARTIEATVAGVSFLGAGSIIVRRNQHVQGLTTAASLLACAAVGMMAAVERYLLAIETTVLLLLVVAGVQRLEARLLPGQRKEKPPESGP